MDELLNKILSYTNSSSHPQLLEHLKQIDKNISTLLSQNNNISRSKILQLRQIKQIIEEILRKSPRGRELPLKPVRIPLLDLEPPKLPSRPEFLEKNTPDFLWNQFLKKQSPNLLSKINNKKFLQNKYTELTTKYQNISAQIMKKFHNNQNTTELNKEHEHLRTLLPLIEQHLKNNLTNESYSIKDCSKIMNDISKQYLREATIDAIKHLEKLKNHAASHKATYEAILNDVTNKPQKNAIRKVIKNSEEFVSNIKNIGEQKELNKIANKISKFDDKWNSVSVSRRELIKLPQNFILLDNGAQGDCGFLCVAKAFSFISKFPSGMIGMRILRKLVQKPSQEDWLDRDDLFTLSNIFKVNFVVKTTLGKNYEELFYQNEKPSNVYIFLAHLHHGGGHYKLIGYNYQQKPVYVFDSSTIFGSGVIEKAKQLVLPL